MDMADTGPIIVAMDMADIGPIIVGMGMVIMVMMIILPLYISNERMTHKEQQNHKLTIGIIVVIQKAIIRMSRNAPMVGYQLLPCHPLHQTYHQKNQLLQLHQLNL